MQSIFSDRERQRIHRRIDALTPDTRPRLGPMKAHRMVCHLVDSIESAFDEEAEAPGTGPLSRQPLNERLTRRKPTAWDAGLRALHDALDRLAAGAPAAHWPTSEVFGTLSRREWGALLRTHVDHHLKQFGT
jgi:hypothetical protein